MVLGRLHRATTVAGLGIIFGLTLGACATPQTTNWHSGVFPTETDDEILVGLARGSDISGIDVRRYQPSATFHTNRHFQVSGIASGEHDHHHSAASPRTP